MKYVLSLFTLLLIILASCDTFFVSYEDFDYAQRTGRRVQVQGVVVGDYDFDLESIEFRFTMQDKNGKQMEVVYQGPKPNGFEHVEQVVITGQVEDQKFIATDILTKCPSKYEEQANEGAMAPEI